MVLFVLHCYKCKTAKILKKGLARHTTRLKGIIEKAFKYFINTIIKNIYFIMLFVFKWSCPLKITLCFLIWFQILTREVSAFFQSDSPSTTLRLLKTNDAKAELPEGETEKASQLESSCTRSSKRSSKWHTLWVQHFQVSLWNHTPSQCEISHINRKDLISINVCRAS